MSIKLKHSGGNSVSLNQPTSAPTSSEVAFKLPNADGTAGQVLKTDGSGNLSWVSQTNTPAFSVYRNGTQSTTSNTDTKVQYNTENFDTNNTFDNSTNYRFTPAVSGKSFLVASVRIYGTTDFNNFIFEIRKNGTSVLRQQNSFLHYECAIVSGIVTHNTTDYFEVFVNQASGSNQDIMSGNDITYFMGYKLIE